MNQLNTLVCISHKFRIHRRKLPAQTHMEVGHNSNCILKSEELELSRGRKRISKSKKTLLAWQCIPRMQRIRISAKSQKNPFLGQKKKSIEHKDRKQEREKQKGLLGSKSDLSLCCDGRNVRSLGKDEDLYNSPRHPHAKYGRLNSSLAQCSYSTQMPEPLAFWKQKQGKQTKVIWRYI